MHLFEALAQHVAIWRESGYEHEQYPAIGEILEWVRSPDVPLFRLRPPQVRALETYWYLRLVENTPHIFDLYKNLFPRVTERLAALGMTHPDMRDLALDMGFEGLVERVRSDTDFDAVEAKKGATIAVKVTDMLGEEVLVLSSVEGLVVKSV